MASEIAVCGDFLLGTHCQERVPHRHAARRSRDTSHWNSEAIRPARGRWAHERRAGSTPTSPKETVPPLPTTPTQRSRWLLARAAYDSIALEAPDLGGSHAEQVGEHGFCVLPELRRSPDGGSSDR